MTHQTPTTDTTTEGPGEIPASTGGSVDLDRVLGRIPVALVFMEPIDDPAALETLRSLGERLADFGRDRIQLLAVARHDQDTAERSAGQVEGNVRVLADPEAELAGRYGVMHRTGFPTTVLVDAHGAVAARWVDEPGGTFADELLERIEGLGG